MKIHHSLYHGLHIAGLLLVLLASGCETLQDIKEPPADETNIAIRVNELEQQGQYREAAELLLKQAMQLTEPAKSDQRIRAATLLINAGMIDQANTLVQRLQAEVSDDLQKNRLQLLQARILLHQEQPEQALQLLIINAASPDNIRALVHELRARAYVLMGNNLESARERISLDALLTDEEKIRLNREQTWDTLRQFTPIFLQHMTMAPPPDILSGWLALVSISKTAIQSPQLFESEVASWKQQYPEHPASMEILDKLMAYYRAIKKPEKLALILPMSGKLAKAASAIRDGFLAAHYQNQDNLTRTQIRFYDSSQPDQSILQLYQLAVSEGAEFVIGPLDKQKVTELASMSEFNIPILTLNQSEQPLFSNENLFQFGLNPEDEARQIAERASLEGLVNAVTITPKGDWGNRLALAFNQRFQELGGVVLEQAQYDFRSNDLSAPIKKLLNLDESERRYDRLRHTLPSESKFIPRRRQDVDFIFMAAFPRQARTITPQLRFHHAEDIPLYTTSSAYSGKQSAQQNKDMNGVLMCDSRWMLSIPENADPLRQQLYELWPQQMEQYARLFALGVDAYQLPGQLRWLEKNPNESYEGVTGRLNLNAQKQIQRTLKWGQFTGGEIKLLEDIKQQHNNPLLSSP